MKSTDLELILGYLDATEGDFARWLEDSREIDGNEAGTIIEEFRTIVEHNWEMRSND